MVILPCSIKNFNMKKLQPFGYYGGKYNHVEKLYRLFPRHKCFVDVFGGSGVVVLNKEPAIDVYNDIDGNVVNFFRVLREKPEELVRLLELTPYAREEFLYCQKNFDKDNTDIERARMFFMACAGGFGHKIRGGWAKDMGRLCGFYNHMDNFSAISKRFRKILIENKPFDEIIKQYDDVNVFFYCDPPYCPETRKTNKDYQNEMTDLQHIELSALLHSIKGKFLLSGYPSQLYSELYTDMTCMTFESKLSLNPKAKKIDKARTEALWMNYQIEDMFTLAARQEEGALL